MKIVENDMTVPFKRDCSEKNKIYCKPILPKTRISGNTANSSITDLSDNSTTIMECKFSEIIQL
jgi:hypothetical protein